jgi:hypothetical protein
MSKTLLLAIIFTVFGFHASAQEEMTISQFRDAIISAIAEEYPEWQVSAVGIDSIEYFQSEETFPEETPGTYFVNYGYGQYIQDPENLQSYIEQVVRTIGLEAPDLNEYETRLVILLRPDAYLHLPVEGTPDILTIPFDGDLIGAFFLDSQEALAGFQVPHLERIGLSVEQVTTIAKANLKERMGEVYIEHYEGLEVLSTDTGLAAGIPILEETCANGVPNNGWWLADRNTLVRTEFEGGPEQLDPRLELLMAIVGQAVAENAAYSGTIFLCLDGNQQLMTPNVPLPAKD